MPTLLQLAMILAFMMYETEQTDQLDCGETSFSGPNGVFTSPDFPLPFPHSVRCTYSIDVGRNNSVTLKFVSFQSESAENFHRCKHEWLMITCNETTGNEKHNFNKKYCGGNFPETSLRLFDCSIVTLEFFADETVSRGGFLIDYTVIENSSYAAIYELDCGETFFTNSSGFISLPTNPTDFPATVNCTYIISTNVTSRISLSVISLQTMELLRSFQSCDIDNITVGCISSDREIHQNPSLLKTYCRNTYPPYSVQPRFDVFSNCRMVKVSFSSSSYIYGGAFRIPFTVTALDEVCGNTSFTGPTGVIISPQFPLSYSHNLDCVYTIEADRNKTVTLHFLSFEVEQSSLYPWLGNCEHDWLTISCLSSDLASTHPFQDKKYCGERTALILRYSKCDSVIINFVTDSSVTKGGFQLRYTISSSGNSTPDISDEDCGTTSFAGPTGVIMAPQIPLTEPRNLDCVYSIEVDRTEMVLLRFLSFHIRSSWQDDCQYSWLTISCLSNDSVSAVPSQNKKYCGETKPPLLLKFSNCDCLRLHFIVSSDMSSTESGFQLRYTITSSGNSTPVTPDKVCGNTFFTGSTGVITSPRFPLSYPHNIDCVYSIDVDRTKTVLLYSLSFKLEGFSQHFYPVNCDYDWLTISCSSISSVSENPSQNRKYCGERETPLVLRYSSCDSLTLNFVTDSSITDEGFQFRYIITSSGQLACGKTSFSGPYGAVTSPVNFPLPYPLNFSCTYSIDVGRNNSITLKFLSFDLEQPNDAGYCVHDWLMITCKGTTKATPYSNMKFCGTIEWSTSMRFLDCSFMVLTFSGGSSITNGTGFRIYYAATENSGSMNYTSELDCGKTLFTDASGVIILPRNPTDYLVTVNCTYTISTNQTNTIFLRIPFWQSPPLLESFQDCNINNVKVGCLSEGETRLNPNTTRIFCNRYISTSDFNSRQLLFSDCRTLKLSIRSMNYDYRETFRIPYLVLGTNDECGNTSFSAPSGIISSPELPWPFRKDFNCRYTIDGGHVKSVVLSFDPFQLGHWNMMDEPCDDGDWLTIACLVNGTSVAHPFADRKLCRWMPQLVVRFPECRIVLLNYSNDHATFDIGFSVRYRMGDYDEACGNTLFTGPAGVIASPRFPLSYPHKLNCMYSIVGSAGNMISLSFRAFQLQGTSNSAAEDYCYDDWLTVICLSDESAVTNIFPHKKYCGLKRAPLTFTFYNCSVVVLNFITDEMISHGGFRLEYIVTDSDSLCGVRFHDRPSGLISFPWNYTNFYDNFDCNYVINATALSSIMLTIWSFSFQSLIGENCQRDWLHIECISGHARLNHNVSLGYCDNLNSSTQLTVFSCAAVEVLFHKDATATGKAFLIEYTITKYAEETSQPLAISVSTELPFTRSAECEFGCKLSEDGTNCDCTTTTNSSGNLVVNTQMSLSGKPGHSVVISMSIILGVVVAVGLATLLLCRRHRTKHRSEMTLQANEEEGVQLELENDSAAAAETLFADSCSEDWNTSDNVPLRSLRNSIQFKEEMQPVL